MQKISACVKHVFEARPKSALKQNCSPDSDPHREPKLPNLCSDLDPTFTQIRQEKFALQCVFFVHYHNQFEVRIRGLRKGSRIPFTRAAVLAPFAQKFWLKSSVADPGCLSRIRLFSIPDPGSELSPSRIPDPQRI